MNDRNREICTLCLRTIHDREFYEIEEIARQMLEALLLHFNLEGNDVMCIECARKLQNAYDFKSACVNMEKKIMPFFISAENEKLEEYSYRANENIELTDCFKDQKVCRFCVKVTETGYYTLLQENKEHVFIVDMVQKYIPELHLSDTEEIITCEACLIALQSLLNFITNCLNVDEKTQNVDEIVENRLELDDVKEFKLEHEFNDVNIAMEGKYNKCEDNITVKDETSLELDNPKLLIKDEETESFQDTACPSHLNLTNRKIRKGNRCSSRVISEVKVYKCEKCSYDTKRKYNLTQHMLVHENLSEITSYKCGTCLFHTKFKRNLKKHILLHQDLSDVTVYKCETCSYQTKFKGKLKGHMLIHQNVSDVTMYECEMCSYKTKFKSYLKKHMVTHQNVSDVTIFKCEMCSFQSKFKRSLKKHMVIHQNVSDVTIYKCEECSYQSKHKASHKRHLLLHRNLSDVVVYKCATCPYLTRYKDALGRHMRIHQNHLDATL